MKTIDKPDTSKLTKLSKTYSNGDTIILYAAPRCSPSTIDSHSPKFWDHGQGSRASYSYHKSGVVTGNTDRFCVGAPVRRRAAWIECWSENDECWMLWHLSSVSSIAQGKRLIDYVLKSGELPD